MALYGLIYLLQMAGMMGMQDMNAEDMSGKLEDMMSTIRQVNEQFKNPVCTSFTLFTSIFYLQCRA